MTPCAHCGRLGLEGVACVSCGYLPAADDTALLPGFGAAAGVEAAEGDGHDHDEAPSLRRVGLLVVVACLLAVAAAVVLFTLPGVERRPADPLAGAPTTSGASTPRTAGGSSTSRSTSAAPTTSASAKKTSASPTRSPTKKTSARPVARTSSLAPPPTSAPAPPPSQQRSVAVAKGGPATVTGCNPRRCHYLVVTTSGFTAGPHTVSCWSAKAGQFGTYTTTATTSAQCANGRPSDTVWAVVDGVRSPDLAW